MAALKRHFEEAGCSEVETVIASGNVVFGSPSRSPAALEKRIAEHLEARLGYAVATFLRTLPEIAGVAARAPFPRAELEAPGHGLYIGFLTTAPDAGARKRVAALETSTDVIELHGRELYWLRRGSFRDSKMSGNALERALGHPTTLRNATTVRKMAAKFA